MTRRFLGVGILGAVALALGCTQDPFIPKVGKEPIILTLGFSTKTFKLGKADTISVIATNTLTDSVAIAYATDCRFNVTIRSLDGKVVVPPNGERTCIPLARVAIDTFPPKGVITRKVIWTGRTDFIPSGSTTTPLPAGSYYVSGAINAINYSAIAPAVKVDLVP